MESQVEPKDSNLCPQLNQRTQIESQVEPSTLKKTIDKLHTYTCAENNGNVENWQFCHMHKQISMAYRIWQNFRVGKLAVVHKTHYSLENFHSASGCGHHVLYIASDSRGNLSRLAEKLRKS